MFKMLTHSLVVLLTAVLPVSAATEVNNPEPASGATVNISPDRDIQLNWEAATGRTSHKVYFGTDPCSLTLQATTSDTAYTVTGINEFTTYYWRIDEAGSPLITGPVWSFETDRELSDYYGYPDYTWIGAGDRHSWNDPNNWWPKGIPSPELTGSNVDYSFIYAYSTDVIIDANADDPTSCYQIQLGSELTTDPGFDVWGQYAPVFTVTGNYIGGWNIDIRGNSVVNVEEGGYCSPLHLMVRQTAQLHINGGTYHVREYAGGTWFVVGNTARIYIHKGTLRIDPTPTLTYNPGVTSGLTVNTGGAWATPTSYIDIYEGQWRIRGNHVTEITDKIADGWVKAYGGASYGALNVSYDADENFTTVTATDIRKASNPTPADEQANVPQNTAFNWDDGSDVKSTKGHRVYFGTDAKALVVQGDFNTPQEFDPGLLAADTTYYWRVDETSTGGTIATGDVWQFTTATAIALEDFESYNGGNPVTNTWLKGSTGASIAIETAELPVGGGTQSLAYSYNNSVSPYYSEIVKEFSTVQDFTANGYAMLLMQFKGQASNAVQKMYIAISDDSSNIAISNVSDPNVITSEQWQTWYIDLSGFSGVNLSRVKKIRLGFGNRTTPVSGGSGTVYFDNITLSAPQCLNGDCVADVDIDGSCAVNFGDFAKIAQQWRDTSYFDGFEGYANQAALDLVWMPNPNPDDIGISTVTLQTDPNNVYRGSKSAQWKYDNLPTTTTKFSEIMGKLPQPIKLSDYAKLQLRIKVHSPIDYKPRYFYVHLYTSSLLTKDRVGIANIFDTSSNSPFNNLDNWYLWDIDLSDYYPMPGMDDVKAIVLGSLHSTYGDDGYVDIDDVILIRKDSADITLDGVVNFGDIALMCENWLEDGYWPVE